MTAENGPSVGTPLPNVVAALRRTQPWVKLFSVLLFASVGLMVVLGIGAGIAGMAAGRMEMAAAIVVYPVLALVNFFPALYLLRYAKRIRQFATTGQEHDLALALDAQRAYWTFMGVVSLVAIAMACVAVVIAILVGGLSTLGARA